MAKLNTEANTNVKLFFLNGIGPIIATIQSDVTDAIVVRNPCQFGLDETGELTIRDYLEGISNPEKDVIFMKYNIVSVTTPVDDITAAYVSALEALVDNTPKVFVPDNKIIL